jgi:hypothetical protein
LKLLPPPIYSPGELGKLATRFSRRLARLGWARFYNSFRTPHYHSLSPNLNAIRHPAARLLHHLATHGVPAPSSDPPWPIERQDAAFQRGAHPSAARVHNHFLCQDMFDMVHMGYWIVLPYSTVRGLPHLKLAPVGVIPQRERRPRPIIDYSYNGVNQGSLPLAPAHAMQFGHSLQRILQRLAYCNPAYGPPLMAKIDLADGYYRIPLSPAASLELAVVLPADDHRESLIGLPLSLPMGWALSPPYFCAFTETCADMANRHPQQPHACTHPHRAVMQQNSALVTPPPFHPTAILPYQTSLPKHPLSYTDVYIDDFMLVAQHPQQSATMQNLLHHLHTIFRDDAASPRRHIVSQSKVDKGDATFATVKRILGWDIDTVRMTLHLPPHRLERLEHLLHTFHHKRYTTRRQWQQLLGELRSMTLALHSSHLLFTVLQNVLRTTARRMRISALAKRSLQDWQQMLTSITHHPVPIASLVPHTPHYLGATDASGEGLGGWWCPSFLSPDTPPCAWRQQLHPEAKRSLLTATNPTGTLNNNELELQAAVLGYATLLQNTPAQPHRTVVQGTDNTAAHSWTNKGSTTSSLVPASILRVLADESRRFHSRLSTVYLPGETNTIADLLSRSFHLSDTALLDHLNTMAPHQPPWKLVTPPAPLVSALNSAILNKHHERPFHTPGQQETAPRGPFGHSSVYPLIKTHGFNTLTTQCPSYRFSRTDIAWAPWLPAALQSKLGQWRRRYVPWDRPFPYWDKPTPALLHQEN